jgi:hypothetical protein
MREIDSSRRGDRIRTDVLAAALVWTVFFWYVVFQCAKLAFRWFAE